MKCVKVLKKDAEKVKQVLLRSHVFALDYSPVHGLAYVYFPVVGDVGGYFLVEKKCPRSAVHPPSVGAYDQIGDIAIVGEKVKLALAKKLLDGHNIRVVLRRKGIHHGEFRTQDLQSIAGEKRKETVYKESGVSLKLDVEKCYFSPRLSSERMRIARLVQKGEQVLVLFSGVGPYPLVLARHSPAALIVGVEKNPLAHAYAVQNCKKYSQVHLYNMDARDFRSEGKFDRVLMPLPKSAEQFLDVALRSVKKGGVIHFYDFVSQEEIPETSLVKIRSRVKNFKVLSLVKCGQYAPGRFRVCVDFRV